MIDDNNKISKIKKDYMAGKYGAVPVLDSKVAEGLVSE